MLTTSSVQHTVRMLEGVFLGDSEIMVHREAKINCFAPISVLVC